MEGIQATKRQINRFDVSNVVMPQFQGHPSEPISPLRSLVKNIRLTV